MDFLKHHKLILWAEQIGLKLVFNRSSQNLEESIDWQTRNHMILQLMQKGNEK